MKNGEVVEPDIVKDGLVLWYDFIGMRNTDANKAIAHDWSGNGNDGQLQNFNFTAESGYENDGLKFDGVDDYAHSYTDLSSNYSGITIQMTIQLESPGEPTTGNLGYLFHWNDSISEGSAPFVLMTYRTGLRWQSNSSDNDYNRVVVDDVLLDKKKHVATAIRDENTLVLYLDGEEIGRKQLEIPFTNKTGALGIGSNADSAYRVFNGSIYSASFYDKALTPEEVQHNYQIEKERFGIE